MKPIDKDELIASLQDPHKVRIATKAERFFKFRIESPEALFSLIMHYHPRTEVLTPTRAFGLIKQTKTVGWVVDRMLRENITFEALANGPRTKTCDPDWFKRFIPLMSDFSYDVLPPLLLFQANNQELRENPLGSFRLIDGMHRALTLTYKLKTKTIQFQPIESILVLPRIYKY